MRQPLDLVRRILAEEALQKINRPLQVTSQRASALRFADPKVQALWRALLLFQLLPTGFSNRHLRQHTLHLCSGNHRTVSRKVK